MLYLVQDLSSQLWEIRGYNQNKKRTFTMKYSITLAAVVMCRPDVARQLGFIPATDKEIVLDTQDGLGREIWFGYLSERQKQQQEPLSEDSWLKIRVPEDGDPLNEIHKFAEAVNLFFRFMADGIRDNCLAVRRIEVMV